MRTLDLICLTATPFTLALLTGCSGGGGDDDPIDQGNYTVEEFGYQATHDADYQPMRGKVVAVMAHKEVAALDPTGAYGSVADFDQGTLTSGGVVICDGFAFDYAVGGQFDADPEEDILAARWLSNTGDLRIAELGHDGTWTDRFEVAIGGMALHALVAGDVDGDGESELALVWDDFTGLWLTVLENGAVALTVPALPNYGDIDVTHLEVECADLDADGRDEIVLLGNRGPYWEAPWTQRRLPVLEVHDDVTTACMVLAQEEVAIFGHADLHEGNPGRLCTGDFDRYHEGEEIALTRLVFPGWMLSGSLNLQFETFALVGEQPELRRWRRGEEDTERPHLILMVGANLGAPVTEPPDEDLVGFDVTAADTDGDGSDELFTTWFTVGNGGSASCPGFDGCYLAFNLPLDLTPAEIQERWSVYWSPPAHMPPEFPAIWDSTANFQRVGAWAALGTHPPIASSASTCSGWPDLRATHWSFAAGDTDGDARDEVHFTGNDGGLHQVLNNFWSVVAAEPQPNGTYTLEQLWWGRHAENLEPQRLVMTDWDGDDLRVRYTGNMQVALGDPMPLVVVAAPPTKEGAAQNRGGSQTIFERGSGSTKVYSVSTGATVGVWAGYDYEFSDPLGLFRGGASGRVKLEAEVERTVSEMKAQTFTQGYQTSYDKDIIVFQGTLYESYEYEVVAAADPANIGRLLTIDVPVDSRPYKWTLDTYNRTVDPQHALYPFAHTVGDPASYMSEAAAGQLVARDGQQIPGEGFVGWLSPKQNVGEGNGINTVTIDLVNEWTTSTRLGWSVTAEQEVKVGSFVAGFSVGINRDYVWDVSVSETTRYRGEVGDIAQSDWSRWQYGFGLVAYTNGLWSNSANEPSGTQPGTIPFQVETYYTDPRGWGYAGN